MPHVVLRGPLGVEDIWLAFAPTEFHENGMHFKALECYLHHEKNCLLIRSLVVDRGASKTFFVRVAQKEGALTVGLEQLASPDRTDAVKRLIGLFAWRMMQVEPELVIVSSNMADMVRAPLQDA